jgi:uncharacterized membrane protein
VSQPDQGAAHAQPPIEKPFIPPPPLKAGLEPGLARISVLVCGLMVLYGLAWESFIDPVREGSWLWLKVIPLAAAMPGLARAKVYTYQWMSLLIWLYLCEALVRIVSPSVSERWLALGWLLLGLALCGAILLAMQRLKREQKKRAFKPIANDGLQGSLDDEPPKK